MIPIRSYGFIRFCLDNPLADYLRKFYNDVRPWFFGSKDLIPNGLPLFLTKKATPLKNIGDLFKKIMVKYFDKPITVGTIRKVMETALSESTALQESEKNNLSNAMLHDPATAQEYYVAKDFVIASNAINQQWKQFRSAFVDKAPVQTVTQPTLAQPLATPSPAITLVEPSLFTPCVPSLVSSPCQSIDEQSAEENIRVTAQNVANNLVPTPSTKPKGQYYPLKPGDWNCSFCDYTNFARRIVCNRCGKDKNKCSAYEIVPEKPAKIPKSNPDITKVLQHSKNKYGEVIYQVLSKKKGEIWVRQGHVPSNLL